MTTTGQGRAHVEIAISDTITIGTWNNEFSDFMDETLIPQDHRVYEALMNLEIGASVMFSGQFLESDLDHVKEKSIREQGAMERPEYLFKFREIGPPRPPTPAKAPSVAAPPTHTAPLFWLATGGADERLCEELHRGSCYPLGCPRVLHDAVRAALGGEYMQFTKDVGVETPSEMHVMYPDTVPRWLFEGCRLHDCPSAGAVYLVDAIHNRVDVIWYNEQGVQYFGPNAALLAEHHVADLYFKYEQSRCGGDLVCRHEWTEWRARVP